MSVDYNNALAKAILDRYDTEFPAGSFHRIYTGAPPGADNAASGTLLAEVTLPASPWSAATNGTPSTKTKNGTWSTTGVGAGNAGYYRLVNAAGTKLEEGTVTATGGGDVTVDNVSIAVGQPVVVNTFTKTL
jgi:hypothetical protein